MTEAIMLPEIQRETDNDMNQNDSPESAQQMVERQPLPSSHPSDSCSNYSQQQQQQQVEDGITVYIEEMIKDCGDDLLPKCCQVPSTLRHLKKEDYTPQVVSIGPFHYGSKRLQDMERIKRKLFKRFTERTTLKVGDLVRVVKCSLPKVRASYSETIKPVEKKLVKLTLIDAGFIIELFISAYKSETRLDGELSQLWLKNSIICDLLLLENQLPFFFIEELFNEASPHDGSLPSFLDITYAYFRRFNKQNLEPNPDKTIKHFTDLLRLFHLPRNMSREMSRRIPFKEDGSQILLYNANALQEAGIKLKVSESECPLVLKFSGDTLEIPKICVDDDTEVLFRNMIALEQCHYPYDTYITDYALMLDRLVNTNKDVDLLVHNEIVSSYLGDTKSVALLFNGLWKNVTQSNFNSEYCDICKGLNEYCQVYWHRMKATLRREYCHTPWQIVASIAATVLLLFTAVQTIFSILQAVKK